MKNGRVIIGDSDMYYVSFGHGKKNLVVLPGLSDGLATVKNKALLLAPTYKRFLKKYRVYMFSRKNKLPKDYSIRQMAEDQASAMKTLGIEKASLLGVSQGGMIVQYLAIDYPEMVEKLILAVTAPYANETIKEAVNIWIDDANKNDHLAFLTDSAERIYTKAYVDKNRKRLPLLAKLAKPKSYERLLINANAILKFDARKELSKVKCPTLIIAGSDDHVIGNDAPEQLKGLIANSKVHIYEGLGHGSYDEAKDFYQRVLDFCETG